MWICPLASCLMLFIPELNRWTESGVFAFTSYQYVSPYHYPSVFLLAQKVEQDCVWLISQHFYSFVVSNSVQIN